MKVTSLTFLLLALQWQVASGFVSVTTTFAPVRTPSTKIADARSFPSSSGSRNQRVASQLVARTRPCTRRRLGTALDSVSRFYKIYPLLAAFGTCSLKASMADSLAQWRDTCTTKFNLRRNIAMVLYSGTVLGISCEIMYNRLFPLMFGATKTWSTVVKMTLFDGFVNAPLLWLPPAYLLQALLYGTSKRAAMQKYMTDVRYHGLLTKYWSLWVPVTFLNFSLVPPHYRICFVACVSFFWMIILSVAANKDQKDPESCPLEPEPVLLNPRALD
jgi:protein Mpv17